MLGPKRQELKMELRQKRPASVDSGIGLETPERALSPVSPLSSTPSRATTPQSPRWVNSVHVWIVAEINKKAARERKFGLLEQDEAFDEDLLIDRWSVRPEYRQVQADYCKPQQKRAKFRLFRAVPTVGAEEKSTLSSEVDVIETLRSAVTQTRIITTALEVSGAGMGPLLVELREEVDRWFREEGILVICCELVWSVPARQRDLASEFDMKALLRWAVALATNEQSASLGPEFRRKKVRRSGLFARIYNGGGVWEGGEFRHLPGGLSALLRRASASQPQRDFDGAQSLLGAESQRFAAESRELSHGKRSRHFRAEDCLSARYQLGNSEAAKMNY